VSWLVLAICGAPALADRPDEGGGFASFDDADVLDFVDGPEGRVRVHFSVDGPSQTVMDDEDGSGAPDFPERVAATAEHVLEVFDGLGFRAPIPESDLGLEHLGGSGAFDFYLVDFGGSADGQFVVDDCAGGVCTGHMLMENDFSGYGYPSLEVAAEVLTSHELFHAVQAAYAARLPSWMSEGTAVWAEKRLDESSVDFMWLASAYLDEPTRPVDSPPAGTVTAWTYGTALFFEFVTTRTDLTALPELLERMESTAEDDALDAVIELMHDRSDPLVDSFPAFAQWNLGAGRRAGGLEGWDFADRLGDVPLEVTAEGMLEDDNRFYPMATTYFGLEHAGGPLAFQVEDDPTGLHFSLHPSAGGLRSAAEAAVAEWTPDSTALVELGELPAATYFLVGTFPERASQSTKVRFCLGPPEDVEACAPEEVEEPGDTGEPDSPDSPGDTADPDGTDEPEPSSDGGTPKDDGGCSTAPGAWGAAPFMLLGIGLVARRRP
jgi:hypothetical protein